MRTTTPFKSSFILFAALPVLCFLLFGWDGMDAADRGFIPALAYRILSGEVIYQDFFYVRPPLSPYLHTLEMALFPASMEMLAYRFFFFVFMWCAVYWSVKSLEPHFDFGRMGVSPWLLAAIGYLISVHNFFAAPWHTVDGIFFSALGFFLVSRHDKLVPLTLGIFSFGLAALCKQPFGIAPVVGLILVAYVHGLKKSLLPAVAALGLAGLGFGLIELSHPGFLGLMLQQTAGVSSLNEMRWGGYQLYVRPAFYAFGAAGVIWLLLKYALKRQNLGAPMAVVTFIGLAIVVAGPIWKSYEMNSFLQPKAGFNHALVFVGGAIAAISMLKRDRKGNATLLAMTAIAWASGISWGYAIPVLYSFPAVFAIAYFLSNIAGYDAAKWYWPLVFMVVLAGNFGLNYYVYHDANRPELSHDLGPVFPKLAGIKTGDQQFATYLELKAFHDKYQGPFTVLPSLPLAHYLTDSRSPIAVDWAHDAEIFYQVGINRLVTQLESQPTYVFAMRGELHRANEDGHFRCSTLKHVLDHWQRIDSSSQFYVYAQPR